MTRRVVATWLLFLPLVTAATEAPSPAPSPALSPAPSPALAEDRLSRLFVLARAQPSWKDASLNAQMRLLRSAAERQKVVSDPVSDRYLITCYGGPIDLVHFLQLAADVEAGAEPGARLWKEFLAEGGRTFVHWGFDPREPPEAHPDDLPSNALGALFGSEARNSSPQDLEAALRGFFAPFLPLPEALAAKLSHQRGVMGLGLKPTRQDQEASQTWFSARPLLQTQLLNRLAREASLPPLCPDSDDAQVALHRAGFQLVAVQKQAIRIIRLPKKPSAGRN